MTANPYNQMAREFMDLWQKQISAVVSDKRFIHAMLDLLNNMQKGNYAPGTAKAAHSDPAHAAHDDAGVLAELAFRLAMCEKRIAALESAAGEPKLKRPAK